MRIGEFARRAGVSPSKVRFYEAQGLLPEAARSRNGYRAYDVADLRIVSFVDRARALGFSLADIARFMSRPVEERRTKEGLIEALEAKLVAADRHAAEVDNQRRRLASLLAELRQAGHGS